MARASTVTWLSLDKWAEIIGIHPLWFNQMTHATLAPDTSCSGVWYQYAWQSANKLSREDLARFIKQAEQTIANYVGYNLLPDWIVDERCNTERPAIRELFSTGANIRNKHKSIFAKRGYAISGGIKAKSAITTGAAIVRSDADGDGYSELCTVTANTTVTACEIRAYLPGRSGADQYEIRPITVTKAGNVATITFKVWQAVDPDLTERLNQNNDLDAATAGNFETTCDIYRVYNDPQTQVQMLWEQPECGTCGGVGCSACELATQYGCLTIRDTRLGNYSYGAATWDSTDEEFDAAELAVGRDPDRLRLWYYSGWRDESLTCPNTQLEQALEHAIAYYAIALADKEICACDNVAAYINHWREDLSMSNSVRSYQNTAKVLDNPFGPWRGAVYAWNVANQEGRKIGR